MMMKIIMRFAATGLRANQAIPPFMSVSLSVMPSRIRGEKREPRRAGAERGRLDSGSYSNSTRPPPHFRGGAHLHQ